MSSSLYFSAIGELILQLQDTQKTNITRAAELWAESLMNNGMILACGSGHSMAGAIEICGRAGGFIPSRVVGDLALGPFEMLEGVGSRYMELADVRDNDCLVLISNSGRNPFGIEVAMGAKERGTKIIVVTSLESSKKMTSRHSSGKLLYEFADVVLDNCAPFGDATISLPEMPVNVAGTSSVTCAVLLNCVTVEAVEIMISKGQIPPVFMSANVDGGPEYNEKIEKQYAERLYRKF